LAAFLTVEKVDLTITNAEELANQTKTRYGIFKGGSTMNFFRESRIDTYKRMWQTMQTMPEVSFVKSNKEGIDNVLAKDYAYLMESPLIDYEIQRNCNLTQIGGLLDSKGYGIATQQGSPYTEDISLKILEMQEMGDIQKFYNKWWKSGGTCIRDEKKDSKANALNVENVGGIFVVLVGGLILAVIVSIIEFIYYAKKNSSKIKKPLLTQMFDELKFAIQCGGSAKKIQNPTNLKSLQINPELQQHHMKSSSTGNLEQFKSMPIERKKPRESQKLCKQDTMSYLSNSNPGLLINEREAALEAHNALINTHVLPRSHIPHQHSSKVHKHNNRGHYNPNAYPSSCKKGKKKQKNHTNHDKYNEESDYILMRPMTSSKSNLNSHRTQSSEHKSDYKHIVPNHSNDLYYDDHYNPQQEQQISYDRYLSKSQILKQQSNRSSRH